MNKLIEKLRYFIGMNDESYLNLNNFIIGNCNYIVFELPKNKQIIKNIILTSIMGKVKDFYWFKSYEEFENYVDLFNDEKKEIFVIIG